MFAEWAGWGTPLRGYAAPKSVPSQPHPLPERMDGVRRMIDCAYKPSHKALIGLCGMAGLRVSEALAVRPSHFDFNTMILRVLGKGEQYRDVPISDELWSILAPAVTEAFVNNDVRVVGLADRAARKLVTRLGREAKLQRHVKSHDLRATFASEVYDKTLDIRVTQALLGHKSVETTQIYTEVGMKSMRAAVQQI